MKLGLLLASIFAIGVLVAPAAGSSTSARWFITPGKNGVSCELGLRRPYIHPGTYVWCLAYRGGRSYKTARAVQMSSTAKLSVCRGLKCIGNNPDHDPTLRVGRSIDFGPFRCTSLTEGVRCVVPRLGHGFRLSRGRVKRL